MDYYQFSVLVARKDDPTATQRAIATAAGISLGSVNKALSLLKAERLIDEDGSLTPEGNAELERYGVKSAVILAAGTATRMAPLSFERPKALFETKGEILIERMIRQLKAAGIENITVVIGHMKESFFYLADEFGVKLVVNPEYSEKNNFSSIWYARESISNTYILPADQYYVENPFRRYELLPYCTVMRSAADQTVRALHVGPKNIIESSAFEPGLYMRGPAYFDSTFSKKFLDIIEAEKDLPQTAAKWWHVIYLEHARELPMHAREVPADSIYEFDRIQDLAAFDADFLANVDSAILDNICSVLECTRDEITGVDPVKEGLTNLSVLFSVRGTQYIYRHPGDGTDEIINREAEAYSLKLAKKIGLDDTFIYEDPETGWKISKYVPGCIPFDYGNEDHVTRALSLIRKLHESGETSPWAFDYYQDALKLVGLLKEMKYRLPADFDAVMNTLDELAEKIKADQGEPVFCHNDFYGPNILVGPDGMRLIDWEYSAMSDWAYDIGNFVAQGSGYSVQRTVEMLPLYFGRKVTEREMRHCLAAVGIVGYYWYIWAMFKEATGYPVGEWLLVWYRAGAEYSKAALALYRQNATG